MTNDFKNYATKHLGMNGLALDKYIDITSSYISPTIIEERQLNGRIFSFDDGQDHLFRHSSR